MLPPDLLIVLRACGQLGKGGLQMALRGTVKAALTAKALLLPEQGQGHHLTPAEGGLGARVGLGRQRALAKVIDPNVKNSQEGVHIDHRNAPYLGEDRAILQAGGTFRVAIRCQLTPSV
jgi:hypothetical protein